MTRWNVGPYEVAYSLRCITISNSGFHIQIREPEAIVIFDIFTNDCTNERAIDKYFELAKMPNNSYCD